jgi:DNA-binding XRE family transcriptional regulator
VNLATLPVVWNREATEPDQSEWRANLVAWVEYFMEEHRLTTDEAFADAINVSRPTITNIRNEARPMGLKTLIKMHHHLGKQHGLTMERMVYSHPSEAHTTAPARGKRPAKK